MKLGYLLEDYQKTGIKIPLNIKLAKKDFFCSDCWEVWLR